MSNEKKLNFVPVGVEVGQFHPLYKTACRFFTSSNLYADHCAIILGDQVQHCVYDKYSGTGVICHEPGPITQSMIIEELNNIFRYSPSKGDRNYDLRQLIKAIEDVLKYRHGSAIESSIKALKEAHRSFVLPDSSGTVSTEQDLWNTFITKVEEITKGLLYTPPVKPKVPTPAPSLSKPASTLAPKPPAPAPVDYSQQFFSPSFTQSVYKSTASSFRYALVVTAIPKLLPQKYSQPAMLAVTFGLSYYESQSFGLSLASLIMHCLPLSAKTKLAMAGLFLGLLSALSAFPTNEYCLHPLAPLANDFSEECIPLSLQQNFLLIASGILTGMATGVVTEKLLDYAISYYKDITGEPDFRPQP